MTETIYLHDWTDPGYDGLTGKDALIRDFEIAPSVLDGVNIMLASYSYENYSGDAFVLFEKDGKLYEVNGSHCSCYGLEGQWKPEETSIAALQHRLTEGALGHDNWCGNEFAAELAVLLSQL